MDIKDTSTQYRLMSVASGKQFDDTGWILDAPDEKAPGLVRAIYSQKKFIPGPASHGMYRFADWLPITRKLNGSSAPITYKSSALAVHFGLGKLFITFSGYWPERHAQMTTCSFKEMEAYSVCARLRPDLSQVLVVASAGNTARAFAHVCSDNNIPLLLCVPEDNLDALWFDRPISKCVKLIATRTGSDYFDAIHLSNVVVGFDGFFAEGGAKNVARRDGMGTTVLSAADFIGQIPEFYFQAVGSGTGAIAAWEANLRLIEAGGFGSHKMKLMISQNHPFLPMFEAWKAGSRELFTYDDVLARSHASEICAKVLSNRRPPYSLIGGLFDALTDSKGQMYAVSNQEAAVASDLFLQTEGIDIHPAAAVAVASLKHSVESKEVEPGSCIMLNITGGGEQRFKMDKSLFYLLPDLIFENDAPVDEIKAGVSTLKW
ncbi:MAG: cysteate synthase [Bacteroidales bacterium]|nr:cysteate synthase [Bacteroidales bacterium]